MTDPGSARQRITFGQVRPGERRRFELYANLTKGSYAAAKFLFWNNTALEKRGDEFNAYDDFQRFGGTLGEQGIVEYYSDSHRWVIVELYRRSLWIVVTLNSDLANGDASKPCTVVSCHEGLSFTDAALTVYNELHFTAASGTTMYARRKDDGSYVFDQGDC